MAGTDGTTEQKHLRWLPEAPYVFRHSPNMTEQKTEQRDAPMKPTISTFLTGQSVDPRRQFPQPTTVMKDRIGCREDTPAGRIEIALRYLKKALRSLSKPGCAWPPGWINRTAINIPVCGSSPESATLSQALRLPRLPRSRKCLPKVPVRPAFYFRAYRRRHKAKLLAYGYKYPSGQEATLRLAGS